MDSPFVRVIHGSAGIREAVQSNSIAVVIDVFRASSTILALLSHDVQELVLVESVESALSLKPEFLLLGEREGKKPLAFDYDNSPTAVLKKDWKGARVAMTTSNGTRGLILARDGADVIVGSFLNASSIVRYICNSDHDTIIVPIGHYDEERIEDSLCADLLKALYDGDSPNTAQIKQRIKESESAQNMLNRGLQEDLEFCLQIDTYDIVPRMTCDLKIRSA